MERRAVKPGTPQEPIDMTAERASANHRPAIAQGSWQAWAVAARPRSLPVAISPVLVGATLGFARTGGIDLLATLSLGGSVPDRPAADERSIHAADVLASL